jgi:hypothetical protein
MPRHGRNRLRLHQAEQRRIKKRVQMIINRLLGTVPAVSGAEWRIEQKKIMGRIRITGEAIRAYRGGFGSTY